MAKLFASERRQIAVAEMHQGRGQAVVDEITQSGQEAMVVLATLPNRAMCATWSKRSSRNWRHRHSRQQCSIDRHANIFDSTEEEFDKVIAVSLKGRTSSPSMSRANAPTRRVERS